MASCACPAMTFPYLTDGLKLVIVGLGVFAVPEIVALLRQRQSDFSDRQALGGGWLLGIKDWWAQQMALYRQAARSLASSWGVIPGLGGSVVDWIAYGHTIQTGQRQRSEFGKGDVRGVIGPESSNNAKEGGGLVPYLAVWHPRFRLHGESSSARWRLLGKWH